MSTIEDPTLILSEERTAEFSVLSMGTRFQSEGIDLIPLHKNMENDFFVCSLSVHPVKRQNNSSTEYSRLLVI